MHKSSFYDIFHLWIASVMEIAKAVPKVAHFYTARCLEAWGWAKVRRLYAGYAPRYRALKPQLGGVSTSVDSIFSTLSTQLIKETTKHINRSTL